MKKVKENKFIFGIVSIFFLLTTACGHNSTQSQTLNEYGQRDNKDLTGLYFYPTTIRMISKILGDENGKALSEIQKARLFFSWSDDDGKVRETLKQFKKDIQLEGFEMLMQMNTSGNRIDIYMLDRETDDYVLFVDGAEGIFVLEILGNLSAASIRDISQLDMSKLIELFDLQKPEVETTDSLQTDVE